MCVWDEGQNHIGLDNCRQTTPVTTTGSNVRSGSADYVALLQFGGDDADLPQRKRGSAPLALFVRVLVMHELCFAHLPASVCWSVARWDPDEMNMFFIAYTKFMFIS